MKIKFLISSNSDSQNKTSVTFLFTSTHKEILKNLYRRKIVNKRLSSGEMVRTHKMVTNRNMLNPQGEVIIRTERISMATGNRAKLDPLVEQLNKSVKTFLIPHRRDAKDDSDPYQKAHLPFTNLLSRKFNDGICTIYISKNVYGGYSINGSKLNKADMLTVISKFILRATICESSITLSDYVEKLLTYPPNVLYALENRTPYSFYEQGVKQEVRINTRDIGNKEIALEISDGIWGTVSIKDMNTFVNTFKHGSERSKRWNRISPRRLWFEVMGTECSEAQLKLMIAWLKQNRTQDMVDKRAEELLYSLNDVPNMSYYPNWAISLPANVENTDVSEYRDRLRKTVLVKGQMHDWLLVSKLLNNQKHRVNANQSVDSYVIFKRREDGNEILSFKHEDRIISIGGRNVCIDNVQNNSSIGDQLSTRAYIAMNDESVVKAGMIHTIPKSLDYPRLTDDEFISLQNYLRDFSNRWVNNK
jgi:hypothetical protein